MENIKDQSIGVILLLDLFPQKIQSEILNDHKFCRENGIVSDTLIEFPNGIGSFQRSQLYKILKKCFLSQDECFLLTDINNIEWELSSRCIKNKLIIEMKQDSTIYNLDCFWILNSCVDERIKRLRKECKLRLLPNRDIEKWTSTFSQNDIEDYVINEFEEDLANTPNGKSIELMEAMKSGKCTYESLVPQKLQYYERLVGVYSHSKNIVEYSNNELEQHLKELFSNGYYSALTLIFLLSSHTAILTALKKITHNKQELLKYYDWAIINGDIISQIGLIELGFQLLNEYPDIEPKLEKLVNIFLNEETKLQKIKLQLLSALIVFVEGELSQTKVFNGLPPFYRKLASISHASLIFRCALKNYVKLKEFADNIINIGKLNYYCQSLVDMRLEPRWHPEYLEHNQLKNEFLGRIINSFDRNKNKIKSESLKNLLKDNIQKVQNENLSGVFLPGPLEGDLEPLKLSTELTGIIENNLAKGDSSPKSFLPLINLSSFRKVDEKYISKISKILREAKHILADTENDRAPYILDGLAKLAAMTRNTGLSEDVAILCRRYRDYLDVNERPEQILATYLTSAAAFEEDEKWLMYMGNCINELAYLPLTKNGINSLFSWLKVLILIEPKLRCTCGKAIEIIKVLKGS